MNEIIFSQLTAILWMVILIFSMTHPQDFPRSWNSHEIITVAGKKTTQKQTNMFLVYWFVCFNTLAQRWKLMAKHQKTSSTAFCCI